MYNFYFFYIIDIIMSYKLSIDETNTNCNNCKDCDFCDNSHYCINCRNLKNCLYCYHCLYCIGCTNLKNKVCYINNRKATSEECAKYFGDIYDDGVDANSAHDDKYWEDPFEGL